MRALAERGADVLALCHPGRGDAGPGRRAVVVCEDAPRLAAVLRAERVATVFHLAGTRGSGTLVEAARECMGVNVSATLGVLEAALAAGVCRVVLAGSADEYGPIDGPASEDLPLRPASPYAVSKAAATHLALALHAAQSCPVVVARLFSVYGPGQPADRFVAQAVAAAVGGSPFRMTAGTQRRDLVYIDDAVRGLIDCATAIGVEGRVINLGSGTAVRLRDVAETVWRLTGSPAPLEVGARPAPRAELHDTWADITEARRQLRWEPTVGLEEGLGAMIRTARETDIGG